MSQSILDTILEYKRNDELPRRKRELPLREVRRQAELTPKPQNFARALHRTDGTIALIAEIKRASPSKGELVKGEFRPVELAQTYEANGAAAISVLTDERFFKGSLRYLAEVKQTVTIPVLRKDFIIEAYQLYEARAAGADAALLIVAALDTAALRDLYALTIELGLTPLVEVHNEIETERALATEARVIGVNNRDLRSFVTDMSTTARCAEVIRNSGRLVIAPGITSNRDGHLTTSFPANRENFNTVTLVSESGIFTAQDAARVGEMGASAMLVGESIITSGKIAAQVATLARVKPAASMGEDRS